MCSEFLDSGMPFSSVCVCERGVVFVLRTFCYFKYRNRLDPSEKAIRSSYNTRDMYCWVKKKSADSKLVCILEDKVFLLSTTLEKITIVGK